MEDARAQGLKKRIDRCHCESPRHCVCLSTRNRYENGSHCMSRVHDYGNLDETSPKADAFSVSCISTTSRSRARMQWNSTKCRFGLLL